MGKVMKKFFCKVVFLAALSVFAEYSIVERNSPAIEPGTAWRHNLFQISLQKLIPGNYDLSFEVKLENGTEKTSLQAMFFAGKEQNLLPVRYRPWFQKLRIPLKITRESTALLRFNGVPAMSAPGRLLLRNIRLVPLQPESAENLLPEPEFKFNPDGSCSGGWDALKHAKTGSSAVALSPLPGGGVKIPANSSFSLYSPMLILPENSRLKTSVQIKGQGKIRFYLTSAQWKKVNGWKATHTTSPEIHTTDESNVYEFIFPASADNQYYRWRVDIESSESMELSALRLASADGSDEAKEGIQKAELIYENDFHTPLPEGAFTDVRVKEDPLLGPYAEFFTGKSILNLFLPEKKNVKSGALSFWVRFHRDYKFDPRREGFWRLERTGSRAFLAHARLYFGAAMYCSVPSQMFKDEWHHVAYVWDNSRYRKIYFDGRLVFYREWISGAETLQSLQFGREGAMPSFRGAIARIRLYRNAPAAEEIARQYCEKRPVTPFLLDLSAIAGRKAIIRVGFDNGTAQERTEMRRISVYAPDGSRVAEAELSAAVAPRSHAVRAFSWTPADAGDYRIEMKNSSGDSVSALFPVVHGGKFSHQKTGDTIEKELIAEIDCAAPPVSGRYADDGNCRIGSLNGTAFRETLGKTPNSGFTYRMALKNPGKMHWLEFEYPDDRVRTFYCGISQVSGDSFSSPFLDACGVITGDNFPLSGKIRKRGFLFATAKNRPEIGVIFGSHFNRNGESGPAVSKIRLYEIKGTLPENPLNPAGRKIMNWNEDPTMFSYTWFNQYQWNAETSNYDFWREKLDLMVQYTRYIGWNMWSTLFYDYGGNSAPGDRRLLDSLYSAGHFPPAFLDMFARTADREQIPYYLSLNHLSGWSNGNTPTGFAMEMGEEYLSRDFAEAEKRGKEAPELFSADNTLAIVRHRAINPIHPRSIATFRKIFRACLERYQTSPMFQGIDYQATEPLHFSSPEFGYGDYNASLYRTETGSALPEFTGRNRFQKRYQWLRENEWSAWLEWRCRKVTALAAELVRELKGRKLILRVSIGRVAPAMAEELARGLLPDLNRHYREQGLDLKALAAIPNLIVLPDIRPNYTRVANSRNDERVLNFSDVLFSLWKIPGIRSAQITLHDNLEMWQGGGHVPTSRGTEPRNLISFSTPLPDEEYVLENLAWLTAQCDPVMINHGWWGNPETGAYEKFRRFYRAFSEIPEQPFAPAPGVNDPVFVRQNGKMLYLVNLCAWPARVKLAGERLFRLTDAVSGQKAEPAALEIGGYELRVFHQDQAVPVTRVLQEPPRQLLEKVEERMKRLPKALPAALHAAQLYRQNRPAAVWYALQHATLKPYFAVPELSVKHRFSPDGKALTLYVRNPAAEPVESTFSLVDLPKGWQVEENEKTVKLPAGAEKALQFRIQRKESRAGEAGFLRLRRVTTGKEELFSLRFQPVIAKRLPLASQKFSIPDSEVRYPLTCVQSAREFDRNGNFAANCSVGWSPEGIAVTIRLADRDFLPPPPGKVFWEYDSAVVYFNQKENAREGRKSYDADDLVFRIAQVAGKPVVLQGEEQRRCDRVSVRISHGGGRTEYALFFPAELFHDLKLQPDARCGFSLEAINRDRNGRRAVFSLSPEHPHQNPFVWSNLILTE